MSAVTSINSRPLSPTNPEPSTNGSTVDTLKSLPARADRVAGEVKPEAKETKEKADTTLQSGMKTAETAVKAAANEARGLGEDGKAAAADTLEAGQAAANAAADTAGKVADSVKETSQGVLGAIKAPFVYTGNKLGNAFANARLSRGETFSPWMSGVALLGGAGLYTLAKAASWGATFFVTTPALGLGLASLAAIHLGWTIGSRVWNGPKAVETTNATVSNNDSLHNFMSLTNIEADKRIAAELKIIETRKTSVEKLTAQVAKFTQELEELNCEIAKSLVRVAGFEALQLEPAAVAELDQASTEDRVVPTKVQNHKFGLVSTGEGKKRVDLEALQTQNVETLNKATVVAEVHATSTIEEAAHIKSEQLTTASAS